MESGFISQAIEYMQRLILHEKSHFLWAYSFDNFTKTDWSTLRGWFQDPTSSSGWATTNTTEFVSAYAYSKEERGAVVYGAVIETIGKVDENSKMIVHQ